MKEIHYSSFCELVVDVEIDGKFVTLWQSHKRKYYLCIEGQEKALEFNSRKAVDAFIMNM